MDSLVTKKFRRRIGRFRHMFQQNHYIYLDITLLFLNEFHCQKVSSVQPYRATAGGVITMSGTLSWSVHIVADGTGAAYKPTIPGAKIGDPVKAQVGDIVTWGNATDKLTRQPWPTVANSATGDPVSDTSNPPGSALYFSGPIAPGGSSRPQWVVPSTLPDGTPVVATSVINYCSKENPNERGQIIIF